MIGEDQQSDLAVEEQGSLGQVLKGPDTVSGFCKKDYTSQHLRGTGTAIFYFILFFEEYIFVGGEGGEHSVGCFADYLELFLV